MLKNTENQKWIVFAFDATTSLGLPGDAANITANLRKDYGGANALADTNPTELEDGYYAFDMAQEECNADHLLLCPASSTENIVVIGCPAVIETEIARQTGDSYAEIAAINEKINTIDSNVDAILVDTSTTIPALINADSGAGAISWTYTLTDSDDGTPIDGAEVWVTTDAAGEDVVASGSTNSFGVVTFMLDAGAYYFWRKCSGYNFNNPDLETVS